MLSPGIHIVMFEACDHIEVQTYIFLNRQNYMKHLKMMDFKLITYDTYFNSPIVCYKCESVDYNLIKLDNVIILGNDIKITVATCL